MLDQNLLVFLHNRTGFIGIKPQQTQVAHATFVQDQPTIPDSLLTASPRNVQPKIGIGKGRRAISTAPKNQEQRAHANFDPGLRKQRWRTSMSDQPGEDLNIQ